MSHPVLCVRVIRLLFLLTRLPEAPGSLPPEKGF